MLTPKHTGFVHTKLYLNHEENSLKFDYVIDLAAHSLNTKNPYLRIYMCFSVVYT